MPANHTEIEKKLWASADELRANSHLKSSEYSVPVLGLIFLRFADQRFATIERELTATVHVGGRRTIGKTDYQARGVMYLPPQSRFSYLLRLPEGENIGKAINDAMKAIETENEELRGILPTNYTQLNNDTLVALLKTFSEIPMDIEGDIFGNIYEYFLGKFAMSEGQQRRLEREFGREYQLITRDERLEKIAEDIVTHFMSRGQMGKAMVISIDKATAVSMNNKVQKYWQLYLDGLKKQLTAYAEGEPEWRLLHEKIIYMEKTDMAVVISKSQNEIDDLRRKGLDIIPHRRRMEREDLETKFKDADDPLSIVFVCAMWITGFDVPSLSTLYLDKPMRNHTLMQTIARANRVFEDKVDGLIVDYAGVFRDLQKALAIYGSGSGGNVQEGDVPVKDKGELVNDLRSQINETRTFCEERGIDIQAILASTPKGFQRIGLVQDAVDALLVNDETKKQYLSLANVVSRLYKAILPDLAATAFSGIVALFVVIAREMALTIDSDISQIMGGIEQLLDISVATKDYMIREPGVAYQAQTLIDLNQIDFDALQAQFQTKHKHIDFEKLRGAVEQKLKMMVRLNKSRADYYERFQRLIDSYNADSKNVDLYLHELMAFTRTLNQEEQRHISEQLSEEELAIFDLLTQPNTTLTEQEKAEVKKVARTLLETLKREKLVLDWRKKQQAKADVQLTIDLMLDTLPLSYTREVYLQLCIDVYQHVYESYFGQGKSIYAMAS